MNFMRLQTTEQKESERIYRKKVLEQRLGHRIFDSHYKYGDKDFYINSWVLPQISKFKEILNREKGLREKIKDGIILELGSESGHISSFIRNNLEPRMVIASDIANSLIEATSFIAIALGFRKRPKMIILDNYSLPFKDASVDFIFGFSVLHHVPYPYSILKEVKRVMKKDGIVVFSGEPFLPGYLLPLQFLYSRFDKKQGICEKVFSLRQWCDFLNDFNDVSFNLETPMVLKFLSQFKYFCKYVTGGGVTFILRK